MKPYASVVYLTKNGGDLFRKSLETVCKQSVKFNYEIVAVDSGSTDGTLELLSDAPGVSVVTIPPERFNFGATRDYGFSLAKGDIIVTLSQDVVPADLNWLMHMVAPFADTYVAAVQGMDVTPVDQEVFYWYQNGLFYSTNDVRKWNKQHDGIGLSFTSCAIRRSVWCQYPIGRAEMNEDKVFQKHIAGKGFKFLYQPLARTYHAHMYDCGSLAKRCKNEGMGWRYCGLEYTFWDMVADMFNFKRLASLILGIATGKVSRLAEVLFPIIRPLYLYLGNHFSHTYAR